MSDAWKNRQVIIPVQVRDGTLRYPRGLPLPRFHERAAGDILVTAGAFVDARLARLFLETHWVEFVPKGSVLLAGVDPSGIPRHLVGLLAALPPDVLVKPQGDSWVEIRLQESLALRVGGGKRPALCGCSCVIPSLDEEAGSLNHAYTLISTAFEPGRRSHTGNVFRRIYYQESGRYWKLLEDLRLGFEALWEARLRFALSLAAFRIRSYEQRRQSIQHSLFSDEQDSLDEITSRLSSHSEHLTQAHVKYRRLISGLMPPNESSKRADYPCWVFERAPWLADFSEEEAPLPEIVGRVAEMIWLTDRGLWGHDLFRTPVLPALMRYCVDVLDFVWQERACGE